MIRFKFEAAKKHFFDSAAVTNKLPAAERKVLSRFGAFVRRTGRFSIRSRRKPSPPGTPPSSHTGDLKDGIFFIYDPVSRSVVIGPVKLNQVSFDGDGIPSAGTIPSVLEEGGRITIIEVQGPHSGEWFRKDLRFRAKAHGGGQGNWPHRKRTVAVQGRPFMGPALQKNLPALPGMWKGAISRS